MFKVEVIGNLGADAVVKDAQGNKFVSFRVAHSEHWNDAQGKEQARTTWIDCTMSDVTAKVIPFLKQGVKVFVRGNASLRVYSSPKERMMKAGIQVSVREVELCGGQSDEVPRSVVDPVTAMIYPVTKCYWIPAPTKGMKATSIQAMTDARGNQYIMDNKGFVHPVKEGQQAEDQQGEENKQETGTER